MTKVPLHHLNQFAGSCAPGWLLLLLSFAAAGCGVPPEEDAPSSVEGPRWEVRTAPLRATRCKDLVSGEASGIYLFDEMNDKLRRYPALAARLPFGSVTTCAQAQQFVVVREQLRVEAPGFDPEVYLEAPSLIFVDESSPNGADEDADVPVAQGLTSNAPQDTDGAGWPSPTNPVVRILTYTAVRETVFESYNDCSATFLNKNWLLTAAHCVPPAGPIPLFPFRYDVFSFVRIQWAGPDSDNPISHKAKALGAYSMRYPSRAAFIALDLALIHLPLQTKTPAFLPPDMTQGGAAYLSQEIVGRPNGTFFISGWGAQTPAPPALRIARAPGLEGHPEHFIEARSLPRPPVGVCPGDSGGPLFEESTVNGRRIIVVAGVLSLISIFTSPTNFDDFKGCQASTNQFAHWVRVDTPRVRNWIESKMAIWYGHNDKPATLAALNLCNEREPWPDKRAFACWGKACQVDADCPKEHACRGGALDAGQGCPSGVCPGLTPIVGQCVLEVKSNANAK